MENTESNEKKKMPAWVIALIIIAIIIIVGLIIFGIGWWIYQNNKTVQATPSPSPSPQPS